MLVTESCKDFNNKCAYWAGIGECNRNPGYMRVYCKKSCLVCVAQGKTMLDIKCFHRTSIMSYSVAVGPRPGQTRVGRFTFKGVSFSQLFPSLSFTSRAFGNDTLIFI